MTVRLEWAHAQFFGEGERRAVMGGSLVHIRGSAMRRNLAAQVQGIRLLPACMVLTGKQQRALRKGVYLYEVVRQRLHLLEGETPERLLQRRQPLLPSHKAG